MYSSRCNCSNDNMNSCNRNGERILVNQGCGCNNSQAVEIITAVIRNQTVVILQIVAVAASVVVDVEAMRATVVQNHVHLDLAHQDHVHQNVQHVRTAVVHNIVSV